MFKIKVDEHIQLRIFTIEDSAELYKLTMDSKEHLRQWLGWIHAYYSIEDTKSFIRHTLDIAVKNDGYPLSFAIIYKNKISGTIGFHSVSHINRSAAIGYWIGEQFVGKGIMSKCFNALLTYGYETLNFNRIEVHVAEGNKKSRAIPERFNFVEEGKLREAEWLYDHFVDHIVYSMLKREWVALHK